MITQGDISVNMQTTECSPNTTVAATGSFCLQTAVTTYFSIKEGVMGPRGIAISVVFVCTILQYFLFRDAVLAVSATPNVPLIQAFSFYSPVQKHRV